MNPNITRTTNTIKEDNRITLFFILMHLRLYEQPHLQHFLCLQIDVKQSVLYILAVVIFQGFEQVSQYSFYPQPWWGHLKQLIQDHQLEVEQCKIADESLVNNF